jgi:hypothetical protein
MPHDKSDYAELLKLLRRLNGEMSDLFKHIEEVNEKMTSRLEKSVQEELKAHGERLDQLVQFQESPLE